MKKLWKYIVASVFVLVSLGIIVLNLRLYGGAGKEAQQKDIQLQLNFLEKELKENHLGDRMQQIFPEGFIFANALYGLSWCEYGQAVTQDSIKKRALKEALFAYQQLDTEQARALFPQYLPLNYGVFYAGWKNYLLAKILQLDTAFVGSTQYKQAFDIQCDEIETALKKSKIPFLESYETQAWPADMCIAMASLAVHDKIFTPKYQPTIRQWIDSVNLHLDTATQMIAHKVEVENGETVEGARGCSSTLMLRVLTEIDSAFAAQQAKKYQQHFISTALGLPAVREYPKGMSGWGDIDSGPVILGVGFAATIVSIGTLAMIGEPQAAQNQYKTIHAFGFSTQNIHTKQYLFGALPIADAFIAWGRSSALNVKSANTSSSHLWRMNFHLISLLIIVCMWLVFFAKPLYQMLKKKSE